MTDEPTIDKPVDFRWRLEGPAYWLWVAVRLPLAFLIIWVNLNLWALDPDDFGPAGVPPGVVDSLDAIGDDLRSGAGEEMQQLFPEGYVITHGIYGFSNVDVALRTDDDALRKHALGEARWAMSQIDSDKGREIFSEALAPKYGAFYRGYLAWLRGGIVLADPNASAAEIESFRRDCAEIGAAFRAADTPYLPSYVGMVWPGDSVFLAASLALHDKLFAPKYADVRDRWVDDVRTHRDPSSGMIPHSAEPITGETRIPTRGLSAVLMSRMLWEVDPELAREEYRGTRATYMTARFGLIPGVLEYRPGASGRGDVDSGPLVFGMSGSASVVGIAAAKLHGDDELAFGALSAAHAVGIPIADRYLFGVLPVGEAFIAWAKTTTPWSGPPASTQEWPALMPSGWRFGWHLVSLALLLGIFATEVRRSFVSIRQG